MVYTIHKLAQMASVSVRTLHHYDAIGLLKPAGLGENGYRLYGREELLRLQQILFFRELEFPLVRIKEMLNAPGFDRQEALRQQLRLLGLQEERLHRLRQTITETINGTIMNDESLYEGLDRRQMEEYAEEARQRWGHTDAYRQSVERMKGYDAEELQAIKEEQQANAEAWLETMDKGPESPEAQACAERDFRFLNDRFYDCSLQMFESLVRMNLEDERFAAYFRRIHPNLPEFRLQAVEIYCQKKAA